MFLFKAFACALGDGLLTTLLDPSLAPELDADPRNTESPHSSDTLGNGNGERVKSEPKGPAKKKKKKGLEGIKKLFLRVE